MRVTVSLILNLVANGMTFEEVIEADPYLMPEDVRQALQYAAWLAHGAITRVTEGRIQVCVLPITQAE